MWSSPLVNENGAISAKMDIAMAAGRMAAMAAAVEVDIAGA